METANRSPSRAHLWFLINSIKLHYTSYTCFHAHYDERERRNEINIDINTMCVRAWMLSEYKMRSKRINEQFHYFLLQLSTNSRSQLAPPSLCLALVWTIWCALWIIRVPQQHPQHIRASSIHYSTCAKMDLSFWPTDLISVALKLEIYIRRDGNRRQKKTKQNCSKYENVLIKCSK